MPARKRSGTLTPVGEPENNGHGDPTNLGDAAMEGLDIEVGPTEAAEKMPDTVQVKFEGMAWDVVEQPNLFAELELLVTVTIVGDGRKVMKDHVRHYVNAKVLSVVLERVVDPGQGD